MTIRKWSDSLTGKTQVFSALANAIHEVQDEGCKVEVTTRLTQEAFFGFAGIVNIGKLLADGILDVSGAPLAAPYTEGVIFCSPAYSYIFQVRAGYADETEHMVKQSKDLDTRADIMISSVGDAGKLMR